MQQRTTAQLSVPGFGHSVHKNGDPRAERLLALAPALDVDGRYVGTTSRAWQSG
nr:MULTISPECIES: citrate/2-methylcitrate synthase [Burkholderia cepacia complex]